MRGHYRHPPIRAKKMSSLGANNLFAREAKAVHHLYSSCRSIGIDLEHAVDAKGRQVWKVLRDDPQPATAKKTSHKMRSLQHIMTRSIYDLRKHRLATPQG